MHLHEELHESCNESHAILSWDMEDKSASPTASILGSPLDGAKALYPGLRKRYSQGNMLEMVAEVDGGGHSTRDCKDDLPCGGNEGQSVAGEDSQEGSGGENVD